MTAATQERIEITEPGVYNGMPADVYHADPVPGGSLSSSGARRLLPPSCPALYHYERRNRPAPKREFDWGHAAHRLVLGAGPELVIVNASDWRTSAAQEARKAAHAADKVPLLAREHDEVQAMAAALRAHPVAAALFDPARGGRPEQSLFWVDGPSGVWRRARLDWLPAPSAGRMIVADYKTCHSASPEAIERAVHDHGYHQQAAWYVDGLTALGLADESAAFLFVFQEKSAPYLVTVVELATIALRIGRELNRRAIDIYRDCTATGRWPGYHDDIALIALPPWVEARHAAEEYR